MHHAAPGDPAARGEVDGQEVADVINNLADANNDIANEAIDVSAPTLGAPRISAARGPAA